MFSTIFTYLLVLNAGVLAEELSKDKDSSAAPLEDQDQHTGDADLMLRDSLLKADMRPERHPHGALLVMDAPPPPRPDGPKMRTHTPRPTWARSTKPMQSPIHHGPANIHLLVHDEPPAPRAPGPIIASHPPPQPKFVRSSKPKRQPAAATALLQVKQLLDEAADDINTVATGAESSAETLPSAALEQDSDISNASLEQADQREASAQDKTASEVSESTDKSDKQDAQDDEDARAFEEAMKEARARLMRRPGRATLAVLPNGELTAADAFTQLTDDSVESDDLASTDDLEVTSDKLVRARRTG